MPLVSSIKYYSLTHSLSLSLTHSIDHVPQKTIKKLDSKRINLHTHWVHIEIETALSLAYVNVSLTFARVGPSELEGPESE